MMQLEFAYMLITIRDIWLTTLQLLDLMEIECFKTFQISLVLERAINDHEVKPSGSMFTLLMYAMWWEVLK